MATRAAGAAVGLVFGLTLSWTGLIDPQTIRNGLLFQDGYLMLVFASALAVAFAGTQALKRLRPRALLTGERVEWETEHPDRRQLGGAAVFGTGWAIAGACPGPIVAQLGQGVTWSVFTFAGVVIGIVAYGRVRARAAGAARSVGQSGGGPGVTQPAVSPQTGAVPAPAEPSL